MEYAEKSKLKFFSFLLNIFKLKIFKIFLGGILCLLRILLNMLRADKEELLFKIVFNL